MLNIFCCPAKCSYGSKVTAEYIQLDRKYCIYVLLHDKKIYYRAYTLNIYIVTYSLKQWFSDFLQCIPTQKIFASPRTTIMSDFIKYYNKVAEAGTIQLRTVHAGGTFIPLNNIMYCWLFLFLLYKLFHTTLVQGKGAPNTHTNTHAHRKWP